MDGLILLVTYFGIGALLLYWFHPKKDDGSIDLHKEVTRKPVIKFRLVFPKLKVADKAIQTSPPQSPMSVSSSSVDFPYSFSFDEDYLKSPEIVNEKGIGSLVQANCSRLSL